MKQILLSEGNKSGKSTTKYDQAILNVSEPKTHIQVNQFIYKNKMASKTSHIMDGASTQSINIQAINENNENQSHQTNSFNI